MNSDEFLRAQLEVVRAAVRSGRAIRAVFDIDNTLADTRFRTVAVARQFDALHGSRHFETIALSHVALSGFETALAVSAPTDIAHAFEHFWNSDDGFWNGANFIHDEVIEDMAQLARECAAAGAEVWALTGRIQTLHGATVKWFQRHQLPGVDRIVCKPDLSHRTGPFKAKVLAEWHREPGVALFVTEDGRDITATQLHAPEVPCALFDFPLRYRGDTLEGTPLLPATKVK